MVLIFCFRFFCWSLLLGEYLGDFSKVRATVRPMAKKERSQKAPPQQEQLKFNAYPYLLVMIIVVIVMMVVVVIAAPDFNL